MIRWPGDPEKERTTFGGLSRSALMLRVRSTGNQTTEKRLASLLRKAGLTGWRRRQPILGHPDFTWLNLKIAVFVDGCFWHGHDCGRNVTPKTNAAAWKNKIEGNRARDRRVARKLRRQGWAIIRIWECRLNKEPERCLRRIQAKLAERRQNVRRDAGLS